MVRRLPVCLPVAYVRYSLPALSSFFFSSPLLVSVLSSVSVCGPPYKNLGTRDMGKHRYHSPVRIRWPKWRVYLALARM